MLTAAILLELDDWNFFCTPFQLLIPLDDFLYPVEQNQSLLGLYLRALATQAVRLVSYL